MFNMCISAEVIRQKYFFRKINMYMNRYGMD